MSRPETKGAYRPVSQSLQEYGRGLAGGLIFSLPLLYTMEVWWAGFILQPERLLLYIGVTYLLLLGYNKYAGLREDASFAEVAIDSVEEMALGLLTAMAALWLLGRISLEVPLVESLGKVTMEAMTVAIGVSVGTAQLGAAGSSGGSGSGGKDQGKGDQGKEDQGQARSESADRDMTLLGRFVITGCGAVLFAANVAPTEEIVMLATEVSAGRLLSLVAVSIGLSAIILYFSDFTGSKSLVASRTTWNVVTGVVFTYATALLASALILWFFGRFDGLAPVSLVAETVVLGVAASLGASAGRLLLQA